MAGRYAHSGPHAAPHQVLTVVNGSARPKPVTPAHAGTEALVSHHRRIFTKSSLEMPGGRES